MNGALDSPDRECAFGCRQAIVVSVVAFIKETLGLRACCYVFMFEYPTGLKKLFLYLQQCILQIRDGKKLPSSVITFVMEGL